MADATERSGAAVRAGHDHHHVELCKEAFTMALYVAICLLAALTAVPDSAVSEQGDTFTLIWGTTLGLALAHWLALQACGVSRRRRAGAPAGR